MSRHAGDEQQVSHAREQALICAMEASSPACAPEHRPTALALAQVYATLDMADAVREVMEWGETILPAPFRRRRAPQTPRSRDA